MRAPIHAVKHYVQVTLATATVGTLVQREIADSKSVISAGAEDVLEGSIIKAIYLEFWIRGAETSPGAYQFIFGKAKAGSGGPTFAEIANLHDYNEKANVFFFSQALTNVSGADAIPVVKGWIKVPKGKQRMALGDKWYIAWAGLALDVNLCGFATYKEYT